MFWSFRVTCGRYWLNEMFVWHDVLLYEAQPNLIGTIWFAVLINVHSLPLWKTDQFVVLPRLRLIYIIRTPRQTYYTDRLSWWIGSGRTLRSVECTVCPAYNITVIKFVIVFCFFFLLTVHEQQHQNTDSLVAGQHEQQQLELQHQRRHVVAVVQSADDQLAVVGMPIGHSGPAAVQDKSLHTRIEPKHYWQGSGHHVLAVSVNTNFEFWNRAIVFALFSPIFVTPTQARNLGRRVYKF